MPRDCLALTLFLALSRAAHADDVLVGEGEVLGDARVEQVVLHAEFQRYTVTLPDGRALPLEVTETRPYSSPYCTVGDVSVYPRWELLATPGQREVELDPAGEPSSDALCARLQQAGGITLSPRPTATEYIDTTAAAEAVGRPNFAWGAPTERMAQQRHPLQLVLLLIGLALVAALRGPLWRGLQGLPKQARWDGLVVALIAVVARAGLSPQGLQIAPDAGYERLTLAWGLDPYNTLYGDGFASLHTALQRATRFDPQAFFGLHIALSALAPVVLWGLARAVLKARAGAMVAGVGLALLPVALRLAGSEVAHVPLATLELLGVAGAWGFLLSGAPSLAVLGAAATGFSVHLRPEAMPLCALSLGLLLLGAWRGRTETRHALWAGLLATAGLLALVGMRLASFPEVQGDGPVRFSQWAAASFWLNLIQMRWETPPNAAAWQVFLHPHLTTPLLPALVVLGLGLGLRTRSERPVVGIAVAWWALTLLPVFPKSFPMMDALRLQLPAQAPLLLLAGLGTARLPHAALRWVVAGAVAVGSLLYLPRVTETWVAQAEWALLQRAAETLPPDAIVLVPDHSMHARKVLYVGTWLAVRAGHDAPDWRPMTTFAQAPTHDGARFAWISMTCHIDPLPGWRLDEHGAVIDACQMLRDRCALTPVLTETLPMRHDIDLRFRTSPAIIGLYRIDGCSPPDSLTEDAG